MRVAFLLQKSIEIALLALTLAACGAPDPIAPKRPAIPSGSAIPTLDNLHEWESIWDKRSWIVALREPKNLPVEDLRVRLRNAMLKILPNHAFLDGQANLTGYVASVNLEMLTQPSHSDGTVAFAMVEFPEKSDDPAQKLATLVPSLGLSPTNLLRDATQLQLAIVQNVEEVEWAEPNLQSTLAEEPTYNLPPEFEDTSSAAVALKLIRADVAWRSVVGSNNLPRYEYEKSIELNWTNVAVIDTGVDYLQEDLHDKEKPDLSHIFINPRDPQNCKDDDGNGYIDDVYGIDASIEKEAWNSQMKKVCASGGQPIPGSADIGGGGVKCPPAVDDETRQCSHGTHVAGTIAARHGAKDGSIGVCPSCRIISARVSKLCKHGDPENCANGDVFVDGPINDASQIRAIAYLLNLKDASGSPYARVVNMSLGKYFISRSLNYWFRKLLEKDILVVAAAGNDDTDTPNYPAAYSPVLSVCATSSPEDAGGRGEYAKASFSNFGSWVDICAPGHKIISTLPGEGTGDKNGTSMATPHVAGAAGFMKSVNPEMSGQEIADALMKYSNFPALYRSATTTNNMNRLYQGWFPDDTRYYLLGTGFLDLAAAVTQGQVCWDDNKQACLSIAYDDHMSGMASQINGGCVVSNMASSAFSLSDILASMPLVMLQLLGLLRLVRSWRRIKR